MLLYGTPSRPITDFLPRLQATLGVVDSDMAVSYLMDAIVQFCRESRLIRRTESIPLEGCTFSYRLKQIGKDERLSEVVDLRLFDADCTKHHRNITYYVDGNTIHLEDLPPCQNGTIEIEYTIVPRRDIELVYDVLYEDWLEAIVHLALARLYRLTDMEWVDFGIANAHQQEYEKILRASRFHTITKHKGLHLRLRPKWGVK